jgi:hypothetical protein
MRTLTPALVALMLAGCSMRDDAEDAVELGEITPDETADFVYEINVYPQRDAADTSALLPQSFFELAGEATDLTLTMRSPAQLSGQISGYLVTPRGPTLPGQAVDVEAEVDLVQESGIQSRFTASSASGDYAVSAVPGSVYDLVIRPNDASLPFLHQQLTLEDDVVIDVALDEGVALWGTIADSSGQPIVGSEVAAQNAAGVRGAPTITNESGNYLLRVQPGSYSLVVLGRDTGRDPVLVSTSQSSGDAGQRVDIQYNSLSLVTVGGRVVAGGRALANARVRFTSESLVGYEGRAAELSVDAVTSGAGNMDTRVIPGIYTVEVFPPSDTSASYVVLESVEISANTDLGTVVSRPFQTFARRVFDPSGEPAANASIRCTELQGDGRSFTTNADVEGAYILSLPLSEVACLITPQGGTSRMAASRIELDLAEEDLPRVTLNVGATVSGVVDADGTPTPFALVEVRDSKGSLWGTALTDTQGQFSLQVAWPLAN